MASSPTKGRPVMKNKTSLTADLRFGDLTQALRLLKSKGVVPDDIAALNSNTALLDDIAATFLAPLRPFRLLKPFQPFTQMLY
jgi:hypothetical protein